MFLVADRFPGYGRRARRGLSRCTVAPKKRTADPQTGFAGQSWVGRYRGEQRTSHAPAPRGGDVLDAVNVLHADELGGDGSVVATNIVPTSRAVSPAQRASTSPGSVVERTRRRRGRHYAESRIEKGGDGPPRLLPDELGRSEGWITTEPCWSTQRPQSASRTHIASERARRRVRADVPTHDRALPTSSPAVRTRPSVVAPAVRPKSTAVDRFVGTDNSASSRSRQRGGAPSSHGWTIDRVIPDPASPGVEAPIRRETMRTDRRCRASATAFGHAARSTLLSLPTEPAVFTRSLRGVGPVWVASTRCIADVPAEALHEADRSTPRSPSRSTVFDRDGVPISKQEALMNPRSESASPGSMKRWRSLRDIAMALDVFRIPRYEDSIERTTE
ncbi:hypothetical protein J2754_003265 [Halarchaeum solikamskense]|nr:hypothetical protein [Halarchaeum solikamskense]